MIKEGTKIESSRIKYPVVKEAFKNCGIDMVLNDPEAPIFWWDGDINPKDFEQAKVNQRMNKIPGMDNLCYKSSFIHALNQMRRLFPKNYKFFPTSFILPHQMSDFQREHTKLQAKQRNNVTWIMKPRSGCCGQGIKIIQHVYEVTRRTESAIIQGYISPYLLNGFKFDFRFYVLISTLSPYTVYIYKEGLARFCTQQYQAPSAENLGDKFCHLTNTSINVDNPDAHNEYTRLASSVLTEISQLSPKGSLVWQKICDVTTFTMLAMWSPIVNSINNYNSSRDFFCRKYTYNTLSSCENYGKYFHILGIDILLNDNLQPIVLELNDRPSMQVTFDCESALKRDLIIDTLKTISLTGTPLNEVSSNFQQLLPVDPSNPISTAVDQICVQSSSIFRTCAPIPTVPRKPKERFGIQETFIDDGKGEQ